MILEPIKAKLIADGVANTTTWKCFIGFAPDSQDQIISLHNTGGFPQDTQEGENMLPTFQARVRAGPFEHAIAEAKWEAVFASLQNADLSASGIRMIVAMSTGPTTLMDEKNRPLLTLNMRVVCDAP